MGKAHLMSGRLQELAERLGGIDIVVNDQDLACRGASAGTWLRAWLGRCRPGGHA
jgi:hypothetical protein